MFSVQTAFANTPEMDLRIAVTELIKKDILNHLESVAQEQTSVRIQFFINSDKQIRIISVNSANPVVQQLVVEKLERAKVDVENLFTKFHYNLTINFTQRA